MKDPFVCAGGINATYGIKFFPSVYCISPDGKILTVPEDRMPAEDFIEEQLNSVYHPRTPPNWSWRASPRMPRSPRN